MDETGWHALMTLASAETPHVRPVLINTGRPQCLKRLLLLMYEAAALVIPMLQRKLRHRVSGSPKEKGGCWLHGLTQPLVAQ